MPVALCGAGRPPPVKQVRLPSGSVLDTDPLISRFGLFALPGKEFSEGSSDLPRVRAVENLRRISLLTFSRNCDSEIWSAPPWRGNGLTAASLDRSRPAHPSAWRS